MLLVEKITTFVAPPNCLVCGLEGTALCAACTSVNLTPYGSRCYDCDRLTTDSLTCPKCRRLGSPGHVWISYLYDGVVEQLVERYKFGFQRSAGHVMAELMARNLPSLADILVMPVPTASRRRRERGFDHAALLARQIAQSRGWDFYNGLLRLGQSRQVGSSRRQRFQQASDDYSVKPSARTAGRHILLVDDVVTTGATLQALSRQLRRAGAKNVDAVVFAKRI